MYMLYRTFIVTDMSAHSSNSNLCYINKMSLKCFMFVERQLHSINVLAMCSVHPLLPRYITSCNKNLCTPKFALWKGNWAIISKYVCSSLLTVILCCLKSCVRNTNNDNFSMRNFPSLEIIICMWKAKISQNSETLICWRMWSNDHTFTSQI